MTGCSQVQLNDPTPSHTRNGNATLGGSLPVVSLGLSGEYAILFKTGVTNVYKSTVVGDVGSSPITGAAILVTCPEVVGTIFSVDAAGQACKVTDASRLTRSCSTCKRPTPTRRDA